MFKEVKGFPGYSISETGEIKSFKRSSTGRLLKSSKDRLGNLVYTLAYREGCFVKYKTVSEHKLVATTYIDNPKNKKNILHLDRDKTNNYRTNLKWATHKESLEYHYISTKVINKRNRLLSVEDVKQVKKYIEDGKSCCSLAKKYNVSATCIINIKKGTSWKNIESEVK